MTIEELRAEWEAWSQSDAAKYSGHLKMPAELWAEKYADKLLAVAEVAEMLQISGKYEVYRTIEEIFEYQNRLTKALENLLEDK